MTSNHKEFSDALFTLLSPLSEEFDQHVQSVSNSQEALLQKIQELRQCIAACHNEANTFINIDPYLIRLSNCRKSVEGMCSDMKVVRDRVQKLLHRARDKYPSVWKAREESLQEIRKETLHQTAQNSTLENSGTATESTIVEQDHHIDIGDLEGKEIPKNNHSEVQEKKDEVENVEDSENKDQVEIEEERRSLS